MSHPRVHVRKRPFQPEVEVVDDVSIVIATARPVLVGDATR